MKKTKRKEIQEKTLEELMAELRFQAPDPDAHGRLCTK